MPDHLVAAWQRNLTKWERRTGVRPRVHLAWTSEETSGGACRTSDC